ncbi:unnamed protein product [Schistocephalus solidus]|uniref:SHSP domain-containing protein n=1 Tax=Schistocephalus solidus TaxID=70667 RepID=A0A183T6L6_SCHSO|nr:unnamed protein product [Schistocephalus solidus]
MFYRGNVATPSQLHLHLPQHGVDAEDSGPLQDFRVRGSCLAISASHGMDAEDSGPLQDFRVRDPVLPSQLQYSVEEAEMEVIQLPGLVRVDGQGLRSVQECH